MKRLFLFLFLISSTIVFGQSIKVQLKPGKGYILDTVKGAKEILPKDSLEYFKITDYYNGQGVFDSNYKGQHIFIPYTSIIETEKYQQYLLKLNRNDFIKNFNSYVGEYSKYGKRFAFYVKNKELVIGMTKAMVYDMYGKADDKTESVVGENTLDMWVYNLPDYKKRFVFFENGIVTGWKQ